MEYHDLVHTSDEFRPQEIPQRLHRFLRRRFLFRLAETERALSAVGPCVGRHDDDGVFKVDRASLRVGDAPFVKDLQQDVHHVRMCLFDLVKQDHRIRFAAYFFRQLSRFVITDVTGRRADDARHGVLLHKLGHIEPNECFRRIEKLRGKLLDQLRFAHAGGADKDERRRSAARTDLHAAAAHCRRHNVDRFVLADDLFAQPVGKSGQTAHIALDDLAGGNACPKLDDMRKVVFGHIAVRRLRFQLLAPAAP